jgi:hypothetical protein
MTDHTWILENLAAYLADGLEPAERERLEQHVNECAPCAAVLANLRTLDAKLTGLFTETRPNATLEDRMIHTLRNRLSQSFRLPLPAWVAIAAAALVLIGFTGAVASQILVNGGLATTYHAEAPPTGSMATELMGYESRKSVEEMAVSSRSSILSHLDREKSVPPGSDRGPRLSDDLPRSSIVDETSKDIKYGEKAQASEPSKPSLPGMMGDPQGNSAIESKGAADVKKSIGETTWMRNPHQGYLSGTAVIMGGLKDRRADEKMPQDKETFSRSSPYMNILRPQGGFFPGQLLARLDDDGRRPQSESGAGKDKDVKRILAEESAPKQKEPGKPSEQPPQQPNPRKIVIRTGEIEYEVQSFDAAVATITRLVKPIKGGFIATVNSDKLANGKVRGSVVVRVPPESLDELILELRTSLGKNGELKNQRIGSQDITKQYTDSESELRAARAMEERLLQIIKSGKGEIKDLLAVEKELGTWRTRIEKIEGELRFFTNQVALSTLTITLFEKEIAAAYGVIEREQVQMGIEVEDVDQAYQAAQKAVREAKGRITRAELKQPSQGQFSALLDFEIAPEAAGPLRDRLKQLGTVARFDIARQEENEGGTGKPSDGKIKRNDTRFHVSFYNLTDVPPREIVVLSLACVDVESAMKTLLERVEKAAGRILASNLNRTRGDQTQGDLQFQVKTILADAVLADAKNVGEVMALQVRELTAGGPSGSTILETTPKKRGFQVKLFALEATTARESEEIQLACTDVAVSYRRLQEAVVKLKGRVRTAQLNEQDRRKMTATLDVEIRRTDEDAIRDALSKAGDVYTRKTSRAADGDNVVDSKVRLQVTLINRANIPPRETYVFGVEVADVDQTAALLSGLAGKREGRSVESNVTRERNGRVTGKLVFDVPMAEVHELLEQVRAAGTVRVQQTAKHPEVADSPLALARLDITLSNKELIVPSDDGVGPSVRRGLSDSVAVLSWSLRFLILGLCVILPWALVLWVSYRLVLRVRRRPTSATPTP